MVVSPSVLYGEPTYLGAAISISKDKDGQVWLRREPPGITTVMPMDALVLLELVSWVADNMPEVFERVSTHTTPPMVKQGESDG